VRFYFEGPSSARVDELKGDFDKMIDDLLQGIGARL